MDLKKLIVDTKSVWIDFPGLPGFEVEVANLSRKELSNLRRKCTAQKFDRKTRSIVETLDEDKFVREFAKATIKNWRGLTLANLENILLIDTEGQNMEQELEYSEENAQILISSSTEFDSWLNEVVFDLENFRSGGSTGSAQPSGEDA